MLDEWEAPSSFHLPAVLSIFDIKEYHHVLECESVILENFVSQFTDLIFSFFEHLLPGTSAVVYLSSTSIDPSETGA